MKWPGLELLEIIVAEHSLDGSVPSILPCVHEELGNDLSVLAAAAARYGGRLFDLTADPREWDDVKRPLSATRSGLVRGVLSRMKGSVPEIVIVENGGHVNVSVPDTPHAEADPSLSPIVRAVSVISSSILDEYDLILYAVDTASLDPARFETLWNLLTVSPVDLGLSAKHTVVPIFSGPVNPDNHYGREPSVRAVVRADRVLRRSTPTTDAAIRAVVSGEQPVVLFLGAGASASAGIPLGNSYRNMALLELLQRDDETDPTLMDDFFEYLHLRDRFLAGESEAREAFKNSLTLERVLRETFHELGVRPRASSRVIQEVVKDCASALNFVRPGRRALRVLADRLFGRLIIVTVNFDELIESGLEVPHLVYRVPEDFRGSAGNIDAYLSGDPNAKLPILKLHGSVSDVESLIASIDVTRAGLHSHVQSVLDGIVRSPRGPVTWVWIGCSMRDKDVNAWLGGLGRDVFDEWWVDPLPSRSLDEFFDMYRESAWRAVDRSLGHRLVIESADRFLSKAAARSSPRVR
jgi:hypothetical protein